jgi:hypothetical protein
MSLIGGALGFVLTLLLAVTGTTGGEARPVAPSGPTAAPSAPSRPPSPRAAPRRNPLADKAEPLAAAGRPRADEPAAGVFGGDIGWPQCPPGMGIPERRTLGKPLPSTTARYVLVGLTNGPGFTANPCLRAQVAFARSAHLWTSAYAVVTYPSDHQLREQGAAGPRSPATTAGRLFNTGYAQARGNLQVMRAAGLRSPTLWLDVEPVRPPAPWSGDTAANRLVLEGSMAAYRRAGLSLGVYSTPYLWAAVVGDAAYGLPEWRAAGPTSRARALAQCTGPAIQGGRPVLVQWSDVASDLDLLCPGPAPLDVLRRSFSAP